MAVLCSNCAGKLIFNPASQKLECANCGAGFRPEDVSDITYYNIAPKIRQCV